MLVVGRFVGCALNTETVGERRGTCTERSVFEPHFYSFVILQPLCDLRFYIDNLRVIL